jgi:putative two-component system response regulator
VKRLRADPRFAELPVIMVTALDSREDRILSVKAGANDFIIKPVDRTELQVRVGSQLKLSEAREALRHQQLELEERISQRTAALRRAVTEMAEAQRRTCAAHMDTIRRLVLAAEFRDMETAHHVVRISHYTAVIAHALHLPPGEVEALGHASTMHDIGKIAIPDAILAKRGLLTPEERKLMQSHTTIGGRILQGSPSELIQAGQMIALSHHEKWDGNGYPRGIAGEDIPLWARICSIADVFDALTTDRPYRGAMSPASAMDQMRAECSSFDPLLLDLFFSREDEVIAILRQFQNREETGLHPLDRFALKVGVT